MNEPWVMPKWMKPFREYLGCPLLCTVEEIINYNGKGYLRRLWREKLKARVFMLEKLHDAGLLKENGNAVQQSESESGGSGEHESV